MVIIGCWKVIVREIGEVRVVDLTKIPERFRKPDNIILDSSRSRRTW